MLWDYIMYQGSFYHPIPPSSNSWWCFKMAATASRISPHKQKTKQKGFCLWVSLLSQGGNFSQEQPSRLPLGFHWTGMGQLAHTGCKRGWKIQHGIFNLVHRRRAKRKGIENSCWGGHKRATEYKPLKITDSYFHLLSVSFHNKTKKLKQ